jgi:hypothetical protein
MDISSCLALVPLMIDCVRWGSTLPEHNFLQALNGYRTVQGLHFSPFHRMLPFDYILSQFLYSVGDAVQTVILNTSLYFMFSHHHIQLTILLPRVIHTLCMRCQTLVAAVAIVCSLLCTEAEETIEHQTCNTT